MTFITPPKHEIEKHQLIAQADEAARIVAHQLGGGQLDDGSPELAYFTMLALIDLLPKLTMPALTVSTDTDDDDDEPITVLVCPHCGVRTREIRSIDGSIRWTSNREMDGDNLTVTFDYQSDEGFDGITYVCVHCERPVSLPEGWAEL